jgi:hypothetical protein
MDHKSLEFGFVTLLEFGFVTFDLHIICCSFIRERYKRLVETKN